jgi:hypothetical protein
MPFGLQQAKRRHIPEEGSSNGCNYTTSGCDRNQLHFMLHSNIGQHIISLKQIYSDRIGRPNNYEWRKGRIKWQHFENEVV